MDLGDHANVSGMLAFYILITYVVAYGTTTRGLHLPLGGVAGAVAREPFQGRRVPLTAHR